ncbi:MAG: YafY family protein [Oscillospiraceae bacterium]|nr:YafY family protein [Oscillospiraceae bacterium]
MKLERLIGILSILLQKEKVTAIELAETFEVSHRTILRDVDALCCAGIPLVTYKGKGGGIAIMDGYKMDKTIFSTKEMQAILAGLQSLDSISGTNRYRQLMEKLSVDAARTLYAENHILIDLSAWDKLAVSDKIEQIQFAMEQDAVISFTYFAPNGDTVRTIEPYHLIFQWANWYVWGYCNLRQDYRMFKLTRMVNLTVTAEKRKERIVPVYVCDKLRHTDGEVEAVVRFDKSVKWRIMDEFGLEHLKWDAEGNILLSFTWSDEPSFYRYILTFGNQAEIISPKAYRERFCLLLQEIAKKY